MSANHHRSVFSYSFSTPPTSLFLTLQTFKLSSTNTFLNLWNTKLVIELTFKYSTICFQLKQFTKVAWRVIIIFERISLDTNIYKEKKKRRNKILLIVAIERFQRGEKEGERGGRCSGVVGIA